MTKLAAHPGLQLASVTLLLIGGVIFLARQIVRYEDVQQIYVETLQVGDQLDPALGLQLADDRNTLILALTSDCGYCTESAPFYRRLSSLRTRADVKTDLLVAMPHAASMTARYLRVHGLGDLATLPEVSFDLMRIAGTPTLVLAAPTGKVLDVWIGRLDESGEADVLTAVSDGEDR